MPWPLRTAIWQRLKSKRRGFGREHYLLCVDRAAQEAVALEHSRICAIEFGVAAGDGLVELERVAAWVEHKRNITIDVYGFDTGQGLPPPVDYRDVPWKWQAGAYKMDLAALQKRLKRAQLVLGDVRETVPEWIVQPHAPVGAALFDLDFWSATNAALKILEGAPETRLPRVYCYFDDIGSVEDIGVLLSIREFNDRNAMRKIRPETNIQHDPNPYLSGWKIFGCHHYDHPDYCKPVREQHM